MDKMIAYCGLNCLSCPIYLATGEEDREKQTEKRKEILLLLKENYGLDYRLEDITDCDGCTAETARLFSACEDCPIRRCARRKRIKNCAHCDDYICEKLEEFFSKEPHAKENLERTNKQLKKSC